MRKNVVIWGIAILTIFNLVFTKDIGTVFAGSMPKSQSAELVAANETMKLKEACLAATITAIELEIKRHDLVYEMQPKPTGAPPLANFLQDLSVLKADLSKYKSMKAEEYLLPQKVTVTGWVSEKAADDSILYVDGMSKSGPWYHLAGVLDGYYGIMEPEKKYEVTFYPVYPRSYWHMQSDYALLAKAVTPLQDKRITGEVFRLIAESFYMQEAKCDNYKVYLLEDPNNALVNKLVLDAKKSAFDIVITAEDQRKYRFLEFVSSNGSALLKLDEIKEEAQRIVLEPEVYLKKPAIYLYPEEKTQITVKHDFKGRISNTYPQYKDNWTVVAEPDGKLFNLKDKRSYEYLFWDGFYSFPATHYQYQTGFYVKADDYIKFLQSKLSHIGLNEKEINDFIVYWLPAMNKYENCFVHFRINDDIDGSSVLKTEPAAETTIRVFMEFKGVGEVENQYKLPEQKLPSFARKGFTLVEWGGAEFGSGKIE
ncbi:MAG: hypothetical protein EOL98_12540 [Negativicutes bacterium]|nr:hypothetical protein [Negativicutes bacterium]